MFVGFQISFFNFRKNVNLQMVREVYVVGFIKMIYLSNNFQEIKYFFKKVKDVVKRFRINCIKNIEKDIFFKIRSIILVWMI